MATLTVTTAADDGAGSLRAAVSAANARAGVDVIAFDAAAFDGGPEDLIRLTSGQIEITDGLTIAGGPSGVTITGDANGDDVTLAGGITDVAASLDGDDRLDDNSRIFAAISELTLDGLTLTGGRTTRYSQEGGAVRGRTLTLIDSTVIGNSTAGEFAHGGGISGSDVTLRNSTVSGNDTAGNNSDGGGIFGGYEGTYGTEGSVTLANSTVSGNSTAGDSSEGGGIWSLDVDLTNSTVSGNSTAGIYSSGGGIRGIDVSLTSSTLSGNSTAGDNSEGGGIWGIYGGVTLTNSIILGNATIFANADEVKEDLGLTLTGGNILGGNLFDDDVDVGDVTAVEVFAATAEIAPGVRAGVLADNGGPTRTILIAAEGPAVDAGGATVLPIDQRGLERVFGTAIDLGAVESGAGQAEPGSLLVNTSLDVVANDGLTSLREAVFFANRELGTDTIIFDASVFGEQGDVIRLRNGQIVITEALTIDGGVADVTITGDANGDDVTLAGEITDVVASLVEEDRLDDNSRIFDATAALTLDGLTLTGGRTMADSAEGGAVRSLFGTSITLIDSTVSGNSTAGSFSRGGGVFGSYLALINSTIGSNSTAGRNSEGGGIWGGGVTLTNSTVSGNSTAERFSGGGGIWGVDVALTNSTVSGNNTAAFSADGGGVSGGSVALTNSTISGNSTAGDGSGGGGVYGSPYGRVTLTNSMVLGNATTFAGMEGDEIEGAVTWIGGNILGRNLFDGEADVGDVTAAQVFAATTEIAPGIFAGVIEDNSGPTQTIAIQANGPAVGTASPAIALATDQRGFSRDAAPDLGAFEAGAEDGLQLFGGPEANVLVGGAGHDRIWGRGENDLLRGLASDDLLRGGNGSDRLEGGGGDDLLRGGKGPDQIGGDTGEDMILGGWGRDRIDGGAGDDLLYGGKGQDVFVFRPDPGADTIVAFDANARGGQDKMDLSALGISAASFSSEVTIDQIGDDTLITLEGGGSILCRGIYGEGVAVIDQSDFLLLA